MARDGCMPQKMKKETVRQRLERELSEARIDLTSERSRSDGLREFGNERAEECRMYRDAFQRLIRNFLSHRLESAPAGLSGVRTAVSETCDFIDLGDFHRGRVQAEGRQMLKDIFAEMFPK